jgi:hypothetical protein
VCFGLCLQGDSGSLFLNAKKKKGGGGAHVVFFEPLSIKNIFAPLSFVCGL